jgi:hypothetical protein
MVFRIILHVNLCHGREYDLLQESDCRKSLTGLMSLEWSKTLRVVFLASTPPESAQEVASAIPGQRTPR